MTELIFSQMTAKLWKNQKLKTSPFTGGVPKNFVPAYQFAAANQFGKQKLAIIGKSKIKNSAFTKGGRGVLLMNSELSASGNKASIEDDNIRIDYTNDKEGMRQDFIIKKKPEGDGKLRLNISADTKLKMIVGADVLMFKDKNGVD